MTLIRFLRARRIAGQLRNYATVYSSDGTDVDAEQLGRLNAAWGESLARSPWAKALRARLDLPDRFPNWETFNRLTPVQRKADLRAVLNAPVEDAPRVLRRATGGSTAEPLRFPVFSSETSVAALDLWLGRQRLGVAPNDRLFLIWGHSHLFGSGLTGGAAKLRRRLYDRALGYTRWSAYRMSAADLRRAADALVSSRARYVIGYSSALDRSNGGPVGKRRDKPAGSRG